MSESAAARIAPSPCTSREYFTSEVDRCKAELDRTLNVLCRDIGRIPVRELAQINTAVENARTAVSHAEAALRRHETAHGCRQK